MSRPRPLDTSDLTGTTRILAERLEPRLQAGAKTFQAMRLVVAALAPLVIAAFLLGVYNATLAKKSDVEAAERAHIALEHRTSVLEERTKNMADDVHDMKKRSERVEDILMGISRQLGAPSAPASGQKRGR